MKKSWLILSIFILSGCAHVTIHDHEWCGDLGELGASCFHTLTTETRQLDKPTWDAERFGDVCAKAEAFADLKTAVLKLCKQTKSCTYEEKQRLNAFSEHLEYIRELTLESSSHL